MDELRVLVPEFRAAIELSIAGRATPHLPYFPDGACRLVSQLLALHLSRRGFVAIRYRHGTLPGASGVRHTWLRVNESTVDLTADPFGQPPVIVATASPFHDSLRSQIEEDALAVIAGLSDEVRERNERFLAQIERRLPARGDS